MGASWLVVIGWWQALRRQRTVVLTRVLGLGSVVIVHGKWKLTHLPLLIFWHRWCRVVQVLTIDIIEYLHLTCLRSQAHLPVPLSWSLWHRISREMLRRWFTWVVLIDASIKHICLGVPSLSDICWRNFNLIEIIVSVVVTLRPSFVKTVHFYTIHLYFIFSVSP